MSISQDKLLPFFVNKATPSDVVRDTVFEILVLEDQIEIIEQQSFYFQMGAKSHLRKLEVLKASYEAIRAFVNACDIDELLGMLNEKRRELRRWENGCDNKAFFGYVMAVNQFKSDIIELENLIYAKGKYKYLKPLEYYLNDEEAIKEIFK